MLATCSVVSTANQRLIYRKSMLKIKMGIGTYIFSFWGSNTFHASPVVFAAEIHFVKPTKQFFLEARITSYEQIHHQKIFFFIKRKIESFAADCSCVMIRVERFAD